MLTSVCRGALVLGILTGACAAPLPSPPPAGKGFPVPAIDWSPRSYVCPKVSSPPRIDGRLDDEAWTAAAWTDEFIDIRGPAGPAPWFSTRAKLAWDDDALYLAASLEEPHIWATFEERDSIIYHENDFELFLDPDGDGHTYHEIEINALNTLWDLFLVRPYRDGAPALHGYDWAGVTSAVALDGTLNRSGDADRGWTLEIAVPWIALEGNCVVGAPLPGDRWRMNMSRVQWHLEPHGEGYRKQVDPVTGEPRAEENWTWTAQGLVAMHYPEMWGILEFSDRPGAEAGALTAEERAGWQLFRVYHLQKVHRVRTGRWAANLAELPLEGEKVPGWSWPPRVEAHRDGFTAWLDGPGGARLRIDEEGRLRGREVENR